MDIKESVYQPDRLKKLAEASKTSFRGIKALFDYVMNFRESQHSELLLEAGVNLVTNYSGSIDDSSYYLIEESFYSALDVKQLDWANMFLKILVKKFPQAPKVMRMLAMLHEALQDHEKARDIYTELLTINPNDTLTLKRLVALERDRDRSNEAISILNKYLEVNMQDTEAWLELTDIYLQRLNYSKAQYCYEELIAM